MWYNLTIFFTIGSSLHSKNNANTTTHVFMSVNGGVNNSQQDQSQETIPPATVIVEAPIDTSFFTAPANHSQILSPNVESHLEQHANLTKMRTRICRIMCQLQFLIKATRNRDY